MVKQHPIQNSAVYVLGQTSFPAIPPPSPPSPITPHPTLCSPIDNLCLDDTDENGSVSRFNERLAGAVQVLNTEATALRGLSQLYANDAVARQGFDRAVAAITCHKDSSYPGKLTVIGVGKSGHIAKKLVATFSSLGIPAQFLHPTEALHGDLGQVGPQDTLMLITFSGKTPELLLLLPHLDPRLPLILMTSHTRPDTCELARHRPNTILLPTPIPESEMVSFGVSAPTTSTTAALTVGDALALVAARELHPKVAAVFAKNHPGGAIGAALGIAGHPYPSLSVSVPAPAPASPTLSAISTTNANAARSLATPLAGIPTLPIEPTTTGLDVLRAAYASPNGWLYLPPDTLCCPSRIRRLSSADMARPLSELLPSLAARTVDFAGVAAEMLPREAMPWLRRRDGGEEKDIASGEGHVRRLVGGGNVGG